MYKLLALDMDGTLLKKDKTISDRTLKALSAARKKGVKVVLATGRPVRGIKKYLAYLGLDRDDEYAVTFNGSAVQTGKSGNMLFEKFITGADLHQVYELSLQHGVHIHAFTEKGQLITPVLNKYTGVESEINDIDIHVKDFKEIKPEDKIIKVMLVDEPEKLDLVYSKLPKELFTKFSIMRSAPIFLEFLNPEANKGLGLSVLSKVLGINKDEVIAVGDAGNDIAMIKYAGLGVAMGNAFPEVKEIADYVTVTNDEDGVAEVIEKFILNQA
ncbi:sugar-phosphatase [Clostridium thermarum]|uniref:sugar-phosphatase n=1 Tax=Clostridium thermarum TaxID=1716543 RepID=UPI0013D68187|nr:sugar-phosphatase [Clostridium thermarum]